MDYKRRALALISVCLFAVSCADNATKTTKAEIVWPEIISWAVPGTSRSTLLTSEPAECLNYPASQNEIKNILLGRLAFRSPYLLGGQAARNGLSCNSCHINGHLNSHFFIDGLSDSPGTADVTNFHFSKTLGDGVFNPKPIPSLRRLTDSPTANDHQARKAFILRLIEKEFDGMSPSATVTSALTGYVDALDPDACLTSEYDGRAMLSHRISVIESTMAIWADSIQRHDEDLNFVTDSVRREFGRLHSRYSFSPAIQAELEQLSQRLKQLSRGQSEETPKDLINDWDELRLALEKHYTSSLFHADKVRDVTR